MPINEKLTIKVQMPCVYHAANKVERAAYDFARACEECDGLSDTVNAVRKAAEALRSTSAKCFDHADNVTKCACRRLVRAAPPLTPGPMF